MKWSTIKTVLQIIVAVITTILGTTAIQSCHQSYKTTQQYETIEESRSDYRALQRESLQPTFYGGGAPRDRQCTLWAA